MRSLHILKEELAAEVLNRLAGLQMFAAWTIPAAQKICAAGMMSNGTFYIFIMNQFGPSVVGPYSIRQYRRFHPSHWPRTYDASRFIPHLPNSSLRHVGTHLSAFAIANFERSVLGGGGGGVA